MKTWNLLGAAFSALCLLLPHSGHAQTPALEPGSTIRLATHGQPLRVVRFDRIVNDTLYFTEGRTAQRHGLATIDRLELQTDSRRNIAKGFTYGFAAGAVAGYIATRIDGCDDDEEVCKAIVTSFEGPILLYSMVGGGLMGGVVGAMIGFNIRSRVWTSIRL